MRIRDKKVKGESMNQLYLQKIRIDWGRISGRSYLNGIKAVRSVEELCFQKPVTFFVGENGTGKSTLLEAIAVAGGFNPEGGTRNYRFSTYDSHSELCEAVTVVRGHRKSRCGYFLRAESFYNVATKEMEYVDADHPSMRLHDRSHGESFFAVAQKYLRPDGLYLLDEPEAALSPQRQLTLLLEISRLAGQGAQFIIASHSPILLGLPDAEILSFDGDAVCPVAYEETESYRVTEMFVNNREYFLKRLLDEP